MIRRNLTVIVAVVVLLGVQSVAAQGIPTRLSDEEFWSMLTDFSEDGGSFHSPNYVSNEATYQSVLPALRARIEPGGVFLGVGPEQNFTYITELKPKVAFIFDIRRQNMLQHLMYKALIELSSDRADFLSRLFSRVRPANLGPESSVTDLMSAFDNLPANERLFTETRDAIGKHLVETHGFKLSAADIGVMHVVLSAFYAGGAQLTYNGPARRTNAGNQRLPTYMDLMTQTDSIGTIAGEKRSFLAAEQNFRLLQDLERRNLIVPLVGDFAGDRAIRKVGEYLRKHEATVSVFYLSNVEQYLFDETRNWTKFYDNVQMLPTDPRSMFIRTVFDGTGSTPTGGAFMARSVSFMSTVDEVLAAYKANRIGMYRDVIMLSERYR